MVEKTSFEHIEFDSLAEVNTYFKEHELVKPLGSDGWGIARIQYPDNIYSKYYVFTAYNVSTNSEITGVHRAIVLMDNCSLFERDIVEEMDINHQPGNGVEVADEDDEGNTPVAGDGLDVDDLEDVFEGGEMPIIFENIEQVKKHFETQVTGLNRRDWIVQRFAEEFDDFPDSHVFVAVNLLESETIDVPWAILPKNKVPESDDAEIMAFPLISYGDVGEEDNDDEPVEASGDEETDENGEPVGKPLPSWNGHTLH